VGFDHPLEFREIIVGKLRDMRIGEPTENKVHFPRATVPAAIKQPLAAVIEPVARTCRPSHASTLRNGKSPDVPGADGIVLTDHDVSTLVVVAVIPARHGGE
jgi:hypothetical protein